MDASNLGQNKIDWFAFYGWVVNVNSGRWDLDETKAFELSEPFVEGNIKYWRLDQHNGRYAISTVVPDRFITPIINSSY